MSYDHIIEWATRDADNKRNDWLGLPLASLSLAFRDDLHAAIADGKVEIVERPAKVQNAEGTRTAAYIVPIR